MTEPQKKAPFFLPNFCELQSTFLLILFSQLLGLIFVLVRYSITALPWDMVALISTYVLWITLTTAAIWCALRKWFVRWPEQGAATACFFIALIVTASYNLLAQFALHNSINMSGPIKINWHSTIQHCAIAAIISGLILRYFYLTGQLERQREAELLHRIQALQSRIQPHFLFNSMNNIASLIATDPEAAETAVENLAELFRASLNKVQKQVPLSEEINLCCQYIELEKLRLQDRLQVQWSKPENIPTHITSPLLLIQPLIENAIYHGIDQMSTGGTIEISIQLNGSNISISVRNPLPQSKTKKHSQEGNHLALDNIQHRLTALYGPSASLKQHFNGESYYVEISYSLQK